MIKYNNTIKKSLGREKYMTDHKNTKKDLDDFWDIDHIAPVRKYKPPNPRSTETVEISLTSEINESPCTVEIAVTSLFESEKLSMIQNNDGTICQYISAEANSEKKDNCEAEYSPKNSLIHNVKIFKLNSHYRYYEEFYNDAKRHFHKESDFAEKVGFFSYVPQYNQMTGKQIDYYIFFRTQMRKGNCVDADLSYILLYCYEIINLGDSMNVEKGLSQLCFLWNSYKARFPYLNKHLIEWICDYCLIHRLAPPDGLSLSDIGEVCSLKEFFVTKSDGGDYMDYARILLSFANSYDYRKSKFAQGENRKLYDRFIPGVLSECVKYLSDGGILKNVNFGDSILPRDAFAGALCSYRVKRRIEVKYCSFSRTNELRYLVGDIVKYCENKIRSYLGIKSKLSCYSIDTDLRRLIDSYFEINLGKNRRIKPKTEKNDYDYLYDLPQKKLSLSDASKIEEESWETTKSLVEAFDDIDVTETAENETAENMTEEAIEPDNALLEYAEVSDLRSALGEYLDFVRAVADSDVNKQRSYAQTKGKMSENIVDAVNEIANEFIGDILIEEIDGKYHIIDEYLSFITEE